MNLPSDLQDFLELDAPAEGGILVPESSRPSWCDKAIFAHWDPTLGSRWSWTGLYLLYNEEEEPVTYLTYSLLSPDEVLNLTGASKWGELGDKADHLFAGAWLLCMILRAVGVERFLGTKTGRTYTVFCEGIPVGVMSIMSKSDDDEQRSLYLNDLEKAVVAYMLFQQKDQAVTKAEELRHHFFPKVAEIEWTLVEEA